MRLLYLDESGDPGWPRPYGNSPFTWFVLSGLCLEDNKWSQINKEFLDIVRKYFGGQIINFDLKYSALTAGAPPFDRLTGIQRLNLADDVFNLILRTKPVLFSIVIDKGRHFRKYPNPFIPKTLALQFMAPRFHKYLERVEDYGIFVMDEEEKNQIKN